MDTPTTSPKPTPRERLKALLAEWGALLIIVWFSIFGLTWVGFVLAIQLGFGDSANEPLTFWGTWGAAYVATQLAKPLRIAATALITPALGALLRRLRRPGAEVKAEADGAPAELPPNGTLDETPSGQP